MTSPTILAVDDRTENLMTLEAVLDGLAVKIIRANSGKEALDISLREEVDLILLDVQMPDMDGFETASFLKKMKRTSGIPIIFVTAISKDEKHVYRGYDVGAVDYLTKPIEPQLLLNKVEVFLNLQQQKKEIVKQAKELEHALSGLERAHQSLQKEQKNLKQAQEVAHMGNWNWDYGSRSFQASEELAQLLGLEGSLSLEDLLEVIHPDDSKMVGLTIRQAISKGESFQLDHRIIRADGEIRMMHQVGELFGGLATGHILCTMLDMSEQKKAEDRLNITEQVFESAIEGVMITDAKSKIISVNPAFSLITGYSAEEAIGKTPDLLRSNRHKKPFYEEMWGQLMDQGHWQGEIWNRRKDGQAYPEFLNIRAIRAYDGKPSNYVGVFHDLSDVKRSEEQLKYQVNHDALTGIFNRTLFLDRLEQAMPTDEEPDKKTAIVTLGLDGFKKINDSLGHKAGDDLLTQAAVRLGIGLGEAQSLSRIGGDEFAMLFKGVEIMQRIVNLQQFISEIFATPFFLSGREVFVTASMGISVAPDDALTAEELMKTSDLALNQAKSMGSSSTHFYQTGMDEEAKNRLQMEGDMRKAIEKQEFTLYYQPKLSFETGEIVGMESLVRWISKERGFVGPDDFIPLAEETGLILPLGAWIFAEACRQTKIWLDQGHQIKVAVNLSARQFQDPNLLTMIDEVLAQTGLPIQNLELEITESMVMGDIEQTIELLQQIQDKGINLSIDDFGTGYSSLSYLKRFPIDALKIDQAFVRYLKPDSEDAAIVQAIIAMAKSLGLKTIAEGVEEKEHVDFLKAEGADLMQGYYFSKPLPAEDFQKLLEEGKNLNSKGGS